MAQSRTEPRTRWQKCRRYFRLAIAFLFSHVGLCTLVMGYALIGAALFQWLESENARKARDHIEPVRAKLVAKLWNITDGPILLQENVWKQQATVHLKEFTANMVQLVQQRGYDGMTKESESTQWDFMGALLYSIIVMTTIGYGDIAPKTTEGKLVTILFAIIGIPLMLVFMSTIGNLLASSFKLVYWRVCCRYCFNAKAKKGQSSRRKPYGEKLRSRLVETDHSENLEKTEETTTAPVESESDANIEGIKIDEENEQKNEEITDQGRCSKELEHSLKTELEGSEDQIITRKPIQLQLQDTDDENSSFQSSMTMASEDFKEGNIPILVCLIIVVCYICVGALLFKEFEEWEFAESAYFCFITLTTIGFGDMVPAKIKDKDQQLINRCYSALYLLFGMALMGMSFNVIKESVIHTVRNIGKKIGLVRSSRSCY